MNNRLLLLLPLAAVACGHPRQLQYDHGRSFQASLATQSDLDRPAAAESAYAITGVEGMELRARATESATDKESGDAEATAKIAVQ
jgi:hypothetical protein